MLFEDNLPKYFWAETINTSCNIINRAMIRHIKRLFDFDDTKTLFL